MTNTTAQAAVASHSTQRMLAWTIWLLSAFFFFYEFMLQIAPGVMNTELMQHFKINATDYGLMMQMYFLAYALMQIPAGLLLDRFGARRLLTVAAGFCGVGTILFASVTQFELAVFARFITGMGSAFAMLGALVLAANWFPSNRFALLHGLIVMVGLSGAVFGEAPLAILVDNYTWQTTMFNFGLFGVCLTLIMWTVIRDKPRRSKKAHREKQSFSEVVSSLKVILTSKVSWIPSIFASLMYAPFAIMFAWGTPYLMLKYNIDKPLAALLISLIFVGGAAGGTVFGAIADMTTRRKIPLYCSATGSLISALLLLYVTFSSIYPLYILFAAYGFFTFGFLPAFTIVKESHRARYSGTSLGFVNMINSLGAALSTFIAGKLLDIFWSGNLDASQVRVYDLVDYQSALVAIPVSIILACFMLPFIKETFGRVTP